MSRFLGGGRTLVLSMGWESDEGLVEGAGTIHGTLPGAGCTEYDIGVARDGRDADEDPLQAFHFRGGGDLGPDYVPPLVRRAFEEWYEKLAAGGPAPSDGTRTNPPGPFQGPMNLLQQLAAEHTEKTGTRLSLPYRALDLCAETGELAQEILRDSGYGKHGAAKPSEKTVAELGDSLFSLLCMANEMHVDVEDVLRVTLTRYRRRLQGTGNLSAT